MKFSEFLKEERMVTVDADDASAVNQVKKASQMDPERLANKRAIDANNQKQTVRQTTDKDDPAARLKQQRAQIASQLAMIDKKIAETNGRQAKQ